MRLSLPADSSFRGRTALFVPIPVLKVSQERESFYVPLTLAQVKAVPLMPDQDYGWLSDEAWRARNDALFDAP